MAFIPNPDIINIGDRVRLVGHIKMFYGTFTEGHEFTVIGDGERGLSVEDDDERRIYEIAANRFRKIQPDDKETEALVHPKEVMALHKLFPEVSTSTIVDAIFAIKNACKP